MTGLDLESFLLLLRADLTTWMVLGLATVVLGLMVWSCWRSRRALRNCLVLSLAAHIGLVLYGSTIPSVMGTVGPDRRDVKSRVHLRPIQVAALVGPGAAADAAPADATVRAGRSTARWDLQTGPLALADSAIRVSRSSGAERPTPAGAPEIKLPPLMAVAAVTPSAGRSQPRGPVRLTRPDPVLKNPSGDQVPLTPLPPDVAEVEQPEPQTASAGAGPEPGSSRVVDPTLASDRRLRLNRPQSPEQMPASMRFTVPGTVERNTARAATPQPGRATDAKARSTGPRPVEAVAAATDPIPLLGATPASPGALKAGGALVKLGDRAGVQGLIEIPKIYQPRLVPDRSAQAQRIGASAASELAVERALDWLARHQDDDGRWDGGIARYDDGTAVKGDDDFTIHCPAGEPCSGECAYWEADSALTGLALLTYLGAGYTHHDGRYTEVVGKGLDYLIGQQKADGDLRGRSEVVGMYCHAMATLALCEAYALTGDNRLQGAAERAIAFLVRARARDGMAWRYAPGAPVGDTSILGWVVMGLKSAKEVGIPIPGEPAVRRGTLLWLEKVATGNSQGLARYQPWEPVTPTMTAEAWVCRQFLGVGGPGPSSSEAAEFLIKNESDRGKTNFYYWYYATLALYQHGGEPWTRWNAKIRDKIVGLQAISGHQTGSWEPDSSLYGSKGGRIYCTTLAALSLEVYYRYLRLYDAPRIPLEAGATPPRRPE
jgi:hypothetical protein